MPLIKMLVAEDALKFITERGTEFDVQLIKSKFMGFSIQGIFIYDIELLVEDIGYVFILGQNFNMEKNRASVEELRTQINQLTGALNKLKDQIKNTGQ